VVADVPRANKREGHRLKHIISSRSNFTLEQATKAQRVSRGIAVLFFQPRHYIGVGGQHQDQAALPPGKTRNPFYRRMGGPV